MRKSRALGAALVGGLLAGFGLWRGRLRRFEVTEDSMAPALRDGDYVLGTRLVSAPMRGNVVVFAQADSPEFLMIKRVVGLPGESVRIDHGRVVVNGHVLAEPWSNGAVAGTHEWQLAGNEVLVLSDNRTVSTADSRELGPVPLGELWKVELRYWPAGRIGQVRQ